MEKKEKISKKQIIAPKMNSISKFRNSISFTSLSNHQFGYFGNNKGNFNFELEKSSNSDSKKSDVESETFHYHLVSDPFSELSKINNVIIKIDYQNCCCVNQSNNLYNVFFKTKNNNIKYLFKSEELMPCTDYSCCEYMQKPFCLNIGHVISTDTDVNTREFAIAKRSCKIPFLCFCRPELLIQLCKENYICGKIVLPFSCGDTEYKIYNSKNKLKYVIDTDYCQPGILCTKNCCGCMPEIIFDIINNKSEVVGTIERKPGGFKEFMHVLDCYQVFFPKGATFEDKLLLICGTFMIESEIFRDKWGSLNYCDSCCDCEDDCCSDCGYHCCAEIFAGLFRF